MMPSALSLAATLADHLWQSTLFALSMVVLAAALRKDRAQVRYYLWFCASVKFLISFSLLVLLGTALAPIRRQVSVGPAVLWIARSLTQPFVSSASSPFSGDALSTSVDYAFKFVAPVLMVSWMLGFAFVLIRFLRHWRRVSRLKQNSATGNYPRERELFRRAQSRYPVLPVVELVFTRAAVDPGLIGIFRPAILLPIGITENLSDEELTAIFLHELCHVRRRDNLVAYLHVLVRALFWFHPLLPFIGTKLLEESERSCDQEVLATGIPPEIYAEGILKVCRFCVEAHVACGSSISGSDLKKRLEDIMNHHALPKLSLVRKVALMVAAAVALFVPIAYGMLYPESRPLIAAANSSATRAVTEEVPSYESISIKASSQADEAVMMLLRPDGFTAKGATLRAMILAAYGLQETQLTGGPEWLNAIRYDVEAKAKLPVVAESYKPGEGPKLPGQMMKALLADRFHLVLRQETKKQEILELQVEKQNSNLRLAKTNDAYADGFKGPDGKPAGPGLFENASDGHITLTGQGIQIGFIARFASELAKHTVVDKTGLPEKYDFTLTVRSGGTNAAEPMFNFSEEAFNEALRQQLGLQLVAKQSAVELTIIEHAEKAKVD